MAKHLIKNLLIVAFIVLAILSIYFSAYLPLAKSRLFIKTLRTANTVTNLEQFKNHFDEVFNFYSPVGQEEVAKFLSSEIINIVSGQSEEVALALVKYLEPKMMRNNVRHLLVLDQAYQRLWQKTEKKTYYDLALAYNQSAYRIGPKLPPVLYGLLQLYVSAGDAGRAREVAEIILKLWPDDEKVKEVLAAIRTK